MVESNMANSNLQLCSRRSEPASAEDIATPVPTANFMRQLRIRARTPFRLCGMLRALVVTCCIVATTVAGMGATRAQTTIRPESAPDEKTAVRAFLTARAWLDADELPPTEAPAASVELAGTSAVCALLRLDGRLVGTGTDATGDALMVRHALGRAVSEALGDETIRAVRAELGDRVTVRLSLEVELAGTISPLLGRTVAEASARLVPGRDGIVLFRGEQTFHAFPSRLAASDSADRPDSTIAGLMLAAGLPAKELQAFDARDRVSLGRFSSIRLRQPTAQADPVEIRRGGRDVSLAEVTPGFERALAAQLCARLAAQVVPRAPSDPREGVALLGTLNPTADRYEPALASPRDEAFAAFALARASTSESIPSPTRKRAQQQALALLRTLDARADGVRSPAVDALLSLALAEAPPESLTTADSELVARASARLPQLATQTFDDAETSALIAAAIAASSLPDAGTTASRLTEQLLGRFTESKSALIDAALPLALLARNTRLSADVHARLLADLQAIAAVAQSIQIAAPRGDSAAPKGDGDGQPISDPTLPADLEGGLLLPSSRSVRADAQCLRLAAGLAIAFPAESTASLELLLMRRRFVRFLAQHVAADPWVDGFRSPDALRGLVRGSLASDDGPPAATAAGLLLVAGMGEVSTK